MPRQGHRHRFSPVHARVYDWRRLECPDEPEFIFFVGRGKNLAAGDRLVNIRHGIFRQADGGLKGKESRAGFNRRFRGRYWHLFFTRMNPQVDFISRGLLSLFNKHSFRIRR